MRDALTALRDDRGSSLLEIVLMTSLLLVVMVMLQQALVTTQRVIKEGTERATTTDQLTTAVKQIERQVRSGNLFYDPEDEDPNTGIEKGMALRIYTQSNADVNKVNYPNGSRCVQWQIVGDRLMWRQWSADQSRIEGWRVAADGVRNAQRGVRAFTLDQSQPQFGRRLLKIVLLTNSKDAGSQPDARVEVSVTGRNTGYGFPAASCEDVPA